jgi:hypothetical protein
VYHATVGDTLQFLSQFEKRPTISAPKGFNLELYANILNYYEELSEIDFICFHKHMLHQDFSIEKFVEISNKF